MDGKRKYLDGVVFSLLARVVRLPSESRPGTIICHQMGEGHHDVVTQFSQLLRSQGV
jgi:hypothetical protein